MAKFSLLGPFASFDKKISEVVDAGRVEVLYGEGVDVRLQGAQQGGEVKEGGLNIF